MSTNNNHPVPTFSSSLLSHIDRHSPSPTMSSLRRSRLLHSKWLDSPVVPPPPPPRRRPSPPPPPPPQAPPASLDEDPDSFFSTTSVSSSDSSVSVLSSTASETEAPSFDPSSKPKTSCFGPLRVKTKPKLPSDHSEEDASTNKSSASSRALKIYSQLKSLKQPISPGLKLAKYINSLTSRKKKAAVPTESDSVNRKFRAIPVPARKYKSEQASPEWSISAPKKLGHGSATSPTSIAAAGSKTVLVKRYEELRRLRTGEIQEEEEEEEEHVGVDLNRKVLEEVALDLLNSYWSRRKEKNDNDDKEEDESSCSSSDLFEIDHLSVIGNAELPVYSTTRIG